MKYARVCTQCTAPDGTDGCFLWADEAAPGQLHHRFVGPRDERLMRSPVFGDLGQLFDWAASIHLRFEPGLNGRAYVEA